MRSGSGATYLLMLVGDYVPTAVTSPYYCKSRQKSVNKLITIATGIDVTRSPAEPDRCQ